MLKLNFANMMDEIIGEKGISIDQIETLRERIEEAYKKIHKKTWNELAFLELSKQDTSKIKETAQRIKNDSDCFILIGIGGSAMGPRAILNALSPLHNVINHPRIFIYDNIDPCLLNSILSGIDLKRTTFNIVSKSGSTAETAASFMILWNKMREVLGENASKRFLATTDPEKGSIRKIAKTYGIPTLSFPASIVGRYSVLSPAGLLLAEIAGIDSNELLHGADEIINRCTNNEIWENPAFIFASLLYLMSTEENRNINVMMPYANGLKSLSEWFCQLWAESLGKLGFGITPYPSMGTTDQHSQLQLWMEGPDDKVVIFIRIEDYGEDVTIPYVFNEIKDFSFLSNKTVSSLIKYEEELTEVVLADASKPNMTIIVPKMDAYHIGQLFQFLEFSTVVIGFLFNVNPFNQPWVEYSKNLVYGLMGREGLNEEKKKLEIAREKKICWII